MKKTFALTIAMAGMMFGATLNGVISDSGCAGNHKAMNMGNDTDCTNACVKAHGAKYVLFDGKTAYTLSDQKTPEQFAGKKVTVTGTVDAAAKTVKVDSIKAAQ
jgi:uncharacterized protein DUF5818